MSTESAPAPVTIIHCAKKRGPGGTCESCSRPAVGTCKFQVKRRGAYVKTDCGRKFCKSCVLDMPAVGPCCLGHARFLGANA